MTINKLNDVQLCEQIRNIHKADNCIDMMLRENKEHALFLNLLMMRDAIDAATERMNRLKYASKEMPCATSSPPCS